MCSSVVPEINALWSPGAAGLVGYGDVPTLAQKPSLYETAWSLKLAAATKTRVSELNLARLRSSMLDVLQSNSSNAVDGLNRITAIYLAAGVLSQLGTQNRIVVEHALEPLRRQGEYRATVGGAASWSATYLAVASLSGAGAKVPPTVLSSLRRQLNGINKLSSNIGALFSEDIPVLSALTDAGMAPFVLKAAPWVKLEIPHWWALTSQLSPSGPVLGYLLSLRQIMLSLGMNEEPVPAAAFRPLSSSTGYYKTFPADNSGDPQTTYDAVALGAPTSKVTLSTLSEGVEPQGWVEVISAPTLKTTFEATVADLSCGVRPHIGQIRTYLKSALNLAAYMSTNNAKNGARSGTIGELCWMSSHYGVNVPPSVKQRAGEAINTAEADSASIAATLASDIQACDLTVNQNLARRLQKASRMHPLETSISAYDAFIVAKATADAALLRLSITKFNELRRGDGYVFDATAEQPDLISTCYGIAAMDASSGVARSKAVAMFETAWGPSMERAGSESRTLPEVDLASLGLGMAATEGAIPGAFIFS
jgi:hypothetical protein